MSANLNNTDRMNLSEISEEELESVSGGFFQELMTSLKLLDEILTNVSKTRAEMGMTVARNLR